MSTTFGIRIPSTDEVKPIARRVGIGQGKVEVWFTEPLAELLDNELEVIAIDNSNQGINTIGDIKKLLDGFYKN
tara:strand:+ start:425 stop:646 length:222 start_codon:yes stop_codon:yes gene_type:complete